MFGCVCVSLVSIRNKETLDPFILLILHMPVDVLSVNVKEGTQERGKVLTIRSRCSTC